MKSLLFVIKVIRKIHNELLEWKEQNLSKSLLIKGSRQVGKTFIIRQFGKQSFKHVIYLNFKDQLDMRQAFDEMLNPTEADQISSVKGVFLYETRSGDGNPVA